MLSKRFSAVQAWNIVWAYCN